MLNLVLNQRSAGCPGLPSASSFLPFRATTLFAKTRSLTYNVPPLTDVICASIDPGDDETPSPEPLRLLSAFKALHKKTGGVPYLTFNTRRKLSLGGGHLAFLSCAHEDKRVLNTSKNDYWRFISSNSSLPHAQKSTASAKKNLTR